MKRCDGCGKRIWAWNDTIPILLYGIPMTIHDKIACIDAIRRAIYV